MRTEVYQAFIPHLDRTVIFEDVYEGEEIVSTTVKGFYFGNPDEVGMELYNGKLNATFND